MLMDAWFRGRVPAFRFRVGHCDSGSANSKNRPENPSLQSTFSPINFDAIVCGRFSDAPAIASSPVSRASIETRKVQVRIFRE